MSTASWRVQTHWQPEESRSRTAQRTGSAMAWRTEIEDSARHSDGPGAVDSVTIDSSTIESYVRREGAKGDFGPLRRPCGVKHGRSSLCPPDGAHLALR